MNDLPAQERFKIDLSSGPTDDKAQTVDSDSLSVSTRCDDPIHRYRLGEELARGGMGVVLAATDTAFDREVAIKVLHPRAGAAAAARFLDEARIAGQLQHPAIPPVHDVGTLADGRPFLAMKLIRGRTLQDALKARATSETDRSRFIAVFEQICQAIGFAHARNVIHRDLKPANVMVGEYGEVQVMDWGLAKVLRDGSAATQTGESHRDALHDISPARDESNITRAGSILGTPAYMPPEQAIGQIDEVDKRSDVFGLGAILCAMLTGEPPFVGADSESTRQLAARAELGDAFLRLDGCGTGPDLIGLCKRCLAGEREHRPADGERVAEEVAALRAASEERIRKAEMDRVAAESEAREQRKRRKVQVALAVSVGLLLLGAGAFAWWEDHAAAARAVEQQRVQNEQRREAEERARVEGERRRLAGMEVGALLDRCEEELRNDDPDRAELFLLPAEKRAAEAGVESHHAKLNQCRNDLNLVRELDRIDDEQPELDPFDRSGTHAKLRRAVERSGIRITSEHFATSRSVLESSFVSDRIRIALEHLYTRTNEQERPVFLKLFDVVDPDPFRSRMRRERSYTQQEELLRSPEIDNQPFWYRMFQIRDLTSHGRPPAKLVKAAIRERPKSYLLLRAMTKLRRGTTPSEQAIREAWIRAALALRPKNAVLWKELGMCLLGSDSPAATDAFAEAVALDGNDRQSRFYLTNAFLGKGDAEQYVTSVMKLRNLDPNDGGDHTRGMLSNLQRKDPEFAMIVLKRFIELEPKKPDFHVQLAWHLWKSNRLEEAEAAAQAALRIDPRHTGNPKASTVHILQGVHTILAAIHLGRGRLAEARNSATLARELEPKNWIVHRDLGIILIRTHEPREALPSLRTARELASPRDHPAIDFLTYRLEGIEGARGSLGRLLLAARDFSEPVRYFANLAWRRLLEKDLNEAERLAKVASYCDSNYRGPPSVSSLFAKIFLGRGDLQLASIHAERAITSNPIGSSEVYSDMALILEKAKKWDLARTYFGRALVERAQGESTAWIEERILALEEKIHDDKLFPDFLKGVARPDARQALALAKSLNEKGELLHAAVFLRDALWRDPKLGEDPQNLVRTMAALYAAFSISRPSPPRAQDLNEWGILSDIAHQCLSDELAVLTKQASEADKQSAARQRLQLWKSDRRLSVLRDSHAIAGMPEMDQAKWIRFWKAVDNLIDAVALPQAPPPRARN